MFTMVITQGQSIVNYDCHTAKDNPMFTMTVTQAGTIHCERESCPPAPCDVADHVYDNGTCCPRCKAQRDCFYGNKTYQVSSGHKELTTIFKTLFCLSCLVFLCVCLLVFSVAWFFKEKKLKKVFRSEIHLLMF